MLTGNAVNKTIKVKNFQISNMSKTWGENSNPDVDRHQVQQWEVGPDPHRHPNQGVTKRCRLSC